MRFLVIFIMALVAFVAQARAQTTINAVYFGQTHVLKATDPYFGLVGNRTPTDPGPSTGRESRG